jgi:DNA-binding LytR/AlgR family response regulator
MDESENKVYGKIIFKLKTEPNIDDPDDINYIQSCNKMIEVYFDKRDREDKTASLAFMLDHLDPRKFVRINGSTIIKLCNVKSYDEHSKSKIVKLKSGDPARTDLQSVCRLPFLKSI